MQSKKRSTRFWVRLLAAVVVCAALPGCSETRHYHAARPTEAVLEIRVGNQWQMIKRERYVYEMPEPYQTLPTVELEALERQAVADGDWPKVSAIRILLEQRKLGLNTKEE